MKLVLTLAWRNLWRNKRRSLITMSSVLFAVFLAILFYSLEQGSYERMIDNMVRFSTGYIQVQDVLFEDEPSMDNSLLFDSDIAGIMAGFSDRIDYMVPRIQNFALAASGNITRGTMVMGIDPASEAKLNDLGDRLVHGKLLEYDDEDIMLAEGLADILRVGEGDSLVLLGQGFQGATAAGIYRIKGIVSLNIPEMNNSTIYMSLPAAQWFYAAEDRLTALVIMPADPGRTQQLAADIAAELDPDWHRVLTWEEMLKDLLTLMKFDMAGTMVMLGILYVVIAFGLFGTMLTMLLERRKEFAMLFALGMKRRLLAAVCFLESVFISLAGVLAGMALALPVVTYFFYNPVQLSGGLADTMMDYGFEPIIPVSLDPLVFISQARLVLILALLIGLYPAYSIFRLNIIKAKSQ